MRSWFQRFLSTSPPLSPSPSKERGKEKKRGLCPLLDTPLDYILQRRVENIRRGANSSKVQSYGSLRGALAPLL